MKFVKRLNAILHESGDAQIQDLTQWNEDIEKVLFANPKEGPPKSEPQDHHGEDENIHADQAKQQMDGISQKLQQDIVTALAKALGVETKAKHQEQLESLVNHVQEHNTDTITVAIADTDSWNAVEKLTQTSGNFLRWYLQVFLKKHDLVYPMSSHPFQSKHMLTLILFLIEYNANLEEPASEQENLSPSQRFARYASLLLFYSTYSPRSPNDEDMQQTHELLVTELNFIPKCLTLLTYPTQTSAPLALSLIRNVHNLLASFAGAIAAVQQTGFQYTFTTEQAPWAPKPDENTNGLITYPSVFRDILIWSLSSSPPFPGPSDDKRPELVVEILGIIFAMGGTEVSRALRYPCPNQALAQLVVMSLQFPQDDPRLYPVQLSTITILTDANPTFGTYLVEQKVLPVLLQIAERQIDTVLEHTRVDETAVSALVPSLATLYKFSAGNPTFREETKTIVFPPSQEDHFWKLAQEQLTQDADASKDGVGDKKVPAAKNMHPLDAPKGSLRWKLIRLMTWTESHIKRYASEFLWALCDEDPKEYVLRTGLGNAMAFLGAKDFVQLPANALE
jgi:Guanine nucleotide exchange factor synembryn